MALRAGIVRMFARTGRTCRPIRCFAHAAHVEEHRRTQVLLENQRLHSQDFHLLANSHGDLVKFYEEQKNADLMLQHARQQYKLLLKLDPPPLAEVLAVSQTIVALLYTSCQYQESESYSQQHLIYSQHLQAPDSPDLARSYFQLAHIQEILGKFADSTANCLAAAEIARKKNDIDFLVLIYQTLANVKKAQQQLGEAQTYIETSLGLVQESTTPMKDEMRASVLTVKGEVLSFQGKFAEAEECHKIALETRRSAKNPDHAELSTCLNNLGMLYLNTGRVDEAEQLFREKLVLDRTLYSETHPSTANSHHNLAAVAEARGDLEGAKSSFLKALEIRNKTLNSAHPHIAVVHQNLVSVCLGLKQIEEAEQHAKLAADIGREVYAESHPFMGTAFFDLGVVQDLKGKPGDAVQWLQKALEIRLQNYPGTHNLIASSYLALGQAHKKLGDMEKASENYGKGYAIMKEIIPADHPDLAIILNNMGSIHYAKGNLEEAEKDIRKSLEIRLGKFQETHVAVASTRGNLATVLLSAKKFAEAEAELRKALRAVEGKADSPLKPNLIAQMLYTALQSQGKSKEAAVLAKKHSLQSS